MKVELQSLYMWKKYDTRSLIGRIDFLTREKKRYVPFDWLSASSTSFQMKIYFAPIQSVKSQYVHNKIRYV